MRNTMNTTLRADEKTLKQLDKYADKMGLSRNQLINNLLTIGVDDLRTLDRLGMLRIGVGIRTLIERMREPDEEPLCE